MDQCFQPLQLPSRMALLLLRGSLVQMIGHVSLLLRHFLSLDLPMKSQLLNMGKIRKRSQACPRSRYQPTHQTIGQEKLYRMTSTALQP